MQLLGIVGELALADEKLERRAIERLAPDEPERLGQLRRVQRPLGLVERLVEELTLPLVELGARRPRSRAPAPSQSRRARSSARAASDG